MPREEEIRKQAEWLKEHYVFCRCGDMVRELTDAYYNGVKVKAIDIESLEEQLSIEDEDGNYPEVMQFWIVARDLGERLKDHGEIVTEFEDGYIWGRTGCGYGLEEDFLEIAEESVSYRENLRNSRK